MTTTPTETVKFHFGLTVADLARTVRFYTAYFGQPPAKHFPDYAKFEVDNPPVALSFLPGAPRAGGGALNHVGVRLNDSASLVAIQHRLEAAGYLTRREDGVECCYALQTKFWVHDPDGVLWETYTLHEDIDHHGMGAAPEVHAIPTVVEKAPEAAAVWVHALNDPFPDVLPAADGSLDEVRLEGSFNEVDGEETLAARLREAVRAVRPGGRVCVRGMVADRPFPGQPDFPGLAAKVKHVPIEKAPVQALLRAGLQDIFIERMKDIDCLKVEGVELRAMTAWGTKPAAPAGRQCRVRYEGPFRQVADDTGLIYPRGEFIIVPAERAERLERGSFTLAELVN